MENAGRMPLACVEKDVELRYRWTRTHGPRWSLDVVHTARFYPQVCGVEFPLEIGQNHCDGIESGFSRFNSEHLTKEIV